MLKGKKVQLRAMEPADVELLYQWENDSRLWHVSNTITPVSRFVLEQYVLNSHQDFFVAKQLRLMIEIVSENHQTIGSIDLFDFDPVHRRAGLGIMIVENEREKGYASEVLQLMIDYCFKMLNLHQLYCNIATDNPASYQLFLKSGFEVTGTKKDWLAAGLRWKDEYLLQMINKSS